MFFSFFFFNDTATTEIYTLSLHDALPIWMAVAYAGSVLGLQTHVFVPRSASARKISLIAQYTPNLVLDRKSTRLNSSHGYISYAVFCLKKKKTNKKAHVHNYENRQRTVLR